MSKGGCITYELYMQAGPDLDQLHGEPARLSEHRPHSSVVLDVPGQNACGLSMTTLPDLLYVALFAVALPLWGYLVSWPAFHRKLQADPARARKRLWIGAIGYP